MNSLLNPIYKDWQAGDTYGSYRIEQLLSDSVLGNFYVAADIESGDTCVLFLLPAGMSKLHNKLAERLLSNLQKLQQVDSSSILELESVQRIQGRIVLRYQHQPVISLTRYVINNPRSNGIYGLEQEKVKNILLQLGHAVRAARSAGIGHYFMTPDFVFVNPDSGKIKLAGCGVFEQLNYRHFETFISSAIHPIGNQDFEKIRFAAIEILSPEMRNLKRVHIRSDFYCLGMCAYFMLTGFKPVRNWTLPSVARTDIHQGWDLFISHCLEYNPDKRFPHISSFIADLEGLEELHAQPKREGRRIMRTLNKIPLPQSIERKFSPVTLLYLRLGLLGVAGALAIFSAIVFSEIIFSDFADSDLSSIAPQRVELSQQANLVLQLPADRIRVQISGRSTGSFLVTDGQLNLRLIPGNYSLHLSSPFLQDKRVALTVSRDTSFETIAMRENFSSVRIQNGVGGAELWAGTGPERFYFVDYFDQEGALNLSNRLYAGTYYFQMRSAHYLDYHWDAQVIGIEGVHELSAQAIPHPAKLFITGHTGVRVSINGSDFQHLPIDIDEIQAEQPVVVEFSAPGFRNHTKELILKAGEAYSLIAPQLEPQVGEVGFDFYLGGSRIRSAEKLSGFRLNTNGKSSLSVNQLPASLPPGDYTWQVSHPELVTQKIDTVVSDGELTTVKLDFEYKPGIVKLESLHLNQSVFTIDGRKVRPVDGQLEIVPGKEVLLRWEVRDFQPAEIKFQLEPGQAKVWSPEWIVLKGPEKESPWQIPYTDVIFEWIPAGEVRMGSPLSEEMRLPNEGPETVVEITNGFWAMRHEVSQRFYQSIVGENPSRFVNPGHPVENINWYEALAFASQLTESERRAGRLPENYVYRLPTEAEWEYMAKGGVEDDRPFHFGFTASRSHGHFSGVYPRGHMEPSPVASVAYGTMEVGQFAANGFGLYDIHGNVAEWTLDHYLDRLPGGRQQNLFRGEGGRGRVVRGGSWSDNVHRTRLAARTAVNENTRRDSVGIRLVLAREL